MRALLQRVLRAEVSVDGRTTGKIEKGLLVLLGVMEGDTEAEAHYLADRICGLRIFEDEKQNQHKPDLNQRLSFHIHPKKNSRTESVNN